ncbi:hypothetical protein GCM10010493_37410 [Streptomyces lavendulae subsp. grasserius]
MLPGYPRQSSRPAIRQGSAGDPPGIRQPADAWTLLAGVWRIPGGPLADVRTG